jgi:hypothetical protein
MGTLIELSDARRTGARSQAAGVIDTPPSAGDSVSLRRHRLAVFEEGDHA